jgi:hypothetical protein
MSLIDAEIGLLLRCQTVLVDLPPSEVNLSPECLLKQSLRFHSDTVHGLRKPLVDDGASRFILRPGCIAV